MNSCSDSDTHFQAVLSSGGLSFSFLFYNKSDIFFRNIFFNELCKSSLCPTLLFQSSSHVQNGVKMGLCGEKKMNSFFLSRKYEILLFNFIISAKRTKKYKSNQCFFVIAFQKSIRFSIVKQFFFFF